MRGLGDAATPCRLPSGMRGGERLAGEARDPGPSSPEAPVVCATRPSEGCGQGSQGYQSSSGKFQDAPWRRKVGGPGLSQLLLIWVRFQLLILPFGGYGGRGGAVLWGRATEKSPVTCGCFPLSPPPSPSTPSLPASFPLWPSPLLFPCSPHPHPSKPRTPGAPRAAETPVH